MCHPTNLCLLCKACFPWQAVVAALSLRSVISACQAQHAVNTACTRGIACLALTNINCLNQHRPGSFHCRLRAMRKHSCSLAPTSLTLMAPPHSSLTLSTSTQYPAQTVCLAANTTHVCIQEKHLSKSVWNERDLVGMIFLQGGDSQNRKHECCSGEKFKTIRVSKKGISKSFKVFRSSKSSEKISMKTLQFLFSLPWIWCLINSNCKTKVT